MYKSWICADIILRLDKETTNSNIERTRKANGYKTTFQYFLLKYSYHRYNSEFSQIKNLNYSEIVKGQGQHRMHD